MAKLAHNGSLKNDTYSTLEIEKSTQPIIERSHYRYGRPLSRPDHVVIRDSPSRFHVDIVHSHDLLRKPAHGYPVCERGQRFNCVQIPRLQAEGHSRTRPCDRLCPVWPTCLCGNARYSCDHLCGAPSISGFRYAGPSLRP
jgi:hypothetical protein